MFKNIRKINGHKYIYLEHSFRIDKKILKTSFYIPKNKEFNITNFIKLNNINTTEIAKKRVEFIKKTQEIAHYHKFGEHLLEIEKNKIIFQIFYNLLSENEKIKIFDEYLRLFLVHSINMEDGTISYKIAKAIDEGKKIPLKNFDEDEIKLYKQLKIAYYKLKEMRLRGPNQIIKLHKIIYEGIYDFAGKFRNENITFGRFNERAITASPENIKQSYVKAFKNYFNSKNKIYDFDRILFFHKEYQEAHGFKDGNSRLGRLILVNQMLKMGYPPLLIYGKKSTTYRTTLVKAINRDKSLDYVKFYFTAYKNTFEKFWLPIIEDNMKKKIKSI